MLAGQLLHLAPHLIDHLDLSSRQLVGQQALYLPVERVPVATPCVGGLPRPCLVGEPRASGPDGREDGLGGGVDLGHVILCVPHRFSYQVPVPHGWLLCHPCCHPAPTCRPRCRARGRPTVPCRCQHNG